MRGVDQWRFETRAESGAVEGQYSYRTPDGGQVNVRYNTGTKGIRRSDPVLPRLWLTLSGNYRGNLRGRVTSKGGLL